MAKQRKPHRRLDVDAVLQGRVRPGAREILELIHEVNPSGHGLRARENARRYAQKSRLQSLLVRCFPEEIVVEPGGSAGVVGLRHRGSGTDACHAVVASLDEDARSWVQMRLDVGDEESAPPSVTPVSEPPPSEPPSAPPSSVPLDALSVGALVARGQEALAAYDLDAARGRFQAALERGSQKAAPLLLTVLVERLGLDEEALAVEARLDADTRKRREVRLLLALAAARTGRREHALSLVRAEQGDGAAEVFVALCRAALAAGETEQATRDANEVQRRAPAHPALQDLAATVKKRRAEERAPAEAAAQRLLDEGRAAEAEAEAATLLARWPESTVAHAIARAGDERRRRAEAVALAAEGHAALERGEVEPALALLSKAVSLGLSGDAAARAEADRDRAEAAVHERREDEKAEAIIHLLGGGHLLRGLTDYVGLDVRQRATVQARTGGLVETALLDMIGIRTTGPEAKAAAQAVMALRRAIAILKDDPRGARNLLRSHWGYVQGIPLAVQAADVAEQGVAANDRAEADQRLLQGMETFDAKVPNKRENLAKTIRVLESVRREHLDEDGQRVLDELLGRFRRMGERIDRAMVVGKLRTKNEFARARDALDALIRFEESIPVAERHEDDASYLTSWREKRAEVVAVLQRSTNLRTSGPPGDATARMGLEAPRLLGVPVSVLPGLPGDEELLLVDAYQQRYFFTVVAVATGRVVRRASYCLRDEAPLLRIQQHAGKVALLGPRGIIEIDAGTWELLRAIGVAFADQSADDTVLAPGGRFLWMTCSTKAWATYLSEDLERSDQGRPFSGGGARVAMQAVPGLPDARLLALRDNGGTLVQHEPRGAVVPGTQHPLWALPLSIAVHPGGEGMVALVREPDREGAESEDKGFLPPAQVSWVELAANGAPREDNGGAPGTGGPARRLADLDPDAPYQVATGRDAGVTFVLYTTFSGTRRLVGLAARGRELAPCFAVDAPARLTLAQDAEARAVVALSPHEGGLAVVRLGAASPSFGPAPPPGPPLGAWPANLVPPRPCAPRTARLWSTTQGETRYRVPLENLVHLTADTRAGLIAGVLDERSLLVPRHALALRLPTADLATELAARALARYPGDPEMAQLAAQRATLSGDWKAVRDLLSPIDPTPLGDGAAQHHDHLLGVALLMLGEAAEARRVLTRGAARPGGLCDLAVPLALLDVEGGARPSPLHAVTRTLDAAVRAADACLAKGDTAGARRALSPLAVREAREVQSLARLARAWIAEQDGPATDRPPGASLVSLARAWIAERGRAKIDTFARRHALAAFVAVHAEKAPALRRELPFVGATWTRSTLDALAAEASELLERERVATLKGEPEEAPAG